MALCAAPSVPRALTLRVALPPHEFDVTLRPGDDVRQVAQQQLQIHRLPARRGPALSCILAAVVEEVQCMEVESLLDSAFPADGPEDCWAFCVPGSHIALLATVSTPVLSAKLADLECTLASRMAEVMATRDGWLLQLRDRHAREMNALATRCLRLPAAEGSVLVKALVEKHAMELQDEADRWQHDIDDVAQKQRREFAAGFEVLLSEDRRPSLEAVSMKGAHSAFASGGAQQGTTVTIELQPRPRPLSRPPEADRLALASVLSGGTSASSFAAPSAAAAGDQRQRSASVLSIEGCVEANGQVTSAEACGLEMGPPPVLRRGEGSLTVELCKGPLAFAFSADATQAKEQRVANLEAIATERLTACLLLGTTSAAKAADLHPAFYQCCTATTELLFDSLETQWQQALRGRALTPADFAITRHSNLNGVHVAFHTMRDTIASGADALLEAMVDRILEMCACWKISCLVVDLTPLPVPRLEATIAAVLKAVARFERKRQDGNHQPALVYTAGLGLGAGRMLPPLSGSNSVQCRLHVSNELHRKVKGILRTLPL